ncbi:MAG: hypothetical protein F2842_01605 [Actinobacteria bacterium]|uniref:Unannotated protein n=1 Tax=freshwater metagenome TaxID=449393 RepID=A0A6J7INF3_9ZZZZ|nr:hypothetical protein [Actinomycetota bacterium]
MQRLICELCKSNNFTKDDEGYFVCDYCRTRYTPSQAQSMMVEGTVRLDRSGDVANLTAMSTNALSARNHRECYEYANRVLEIEPANSEAWFLKGTSIGWQSAEQPRVTELVYAYQRAIEYAHDDETGTITPRCTNQALLISADLMKNGHQLTSHELICRIVDFDPDNSDVHFRIGISTGQLSTPTQPRLGEATSAFERAVAIADPDSQFELRSRCAGHLEWFAVELEKQSWSLFVQEQSWERHYPVSQQVMDSLATSYLWNPRRNPLDHYVSVAQKNLQGIKVTYFQGDRIQTKLLALDAAAQAHAQSQITWGAERIRDIDPESHRQTARPKKLLGIKLRPSS